MDNRSVPDSEISVRFAELHAEPWRMLGMEERAFHVKYLHDAAFHAAIYTLLEHDAALIELGEAAHLVEQTMIAGRAGMSERVAPWTAPAESFNALGDALLKLRRKLRKETAGVR